MSVIDKGKIVTIKWFTANYPNKATHIDCMDVIIYPNGAYIELLKNGDVLYNDRQFMSIPEAEEEMLKNI
jgi:hypothetical protein